MREDFFDSLKQTLTDTVDVVSKKTEDVVEIQKLRSRIHTARRDEQLNYQKLGEVIFQRFLSGETMDGELSELCDEILELQKQAEEFKTELANKKGYIICQACGETAPKHAVFCMRCGAELTKTAAEDIFEEEPEVKNWEEAEKVVQEEDA